MNLKQLEGELHRLKCLQEKLSKKLEDIKLVGDYVESVTGDGVNNSDPKNPIIDLSGYANSNHDHDIEDITNLEETLNDKLNTDLQNVDEDLERAEKAYFRDNVNIAWSGRMNNNNFSRSAASFGGGFNENNGIYSANLGGLYIENRGHYTGSVGGNKIDNYGYYSGSLGGISNLNLGKNTGSIGGGNLETRTIFEIALGTFNKSEVFKNNSYTTWYPEDLLLSIGAGTSEEDRKNALSIYKSYAYRFLPTDLEAIPQNQLLPGTQAINENGIPHFYNGAEWISMDTKHNAYDIHTSNRFTLNLNNWRILHPYGANYQATTSSAGSGETPSYTLSNTNGFLITEDSVLKEIHVSMKNHYPNDLHEGELDFSELTLDGTVNPLGKINFETTANPRQYKVLQINKPLLAGSMIVFGGRKTTQGRTGTSYAYTALTFKLEN